MPAPAPRPLPGAAPGRPGCGRRRLLPERMIDMSRTRANRRALIAGLVCFAAVLAVGALLDQQGVRLPSSVIGVTIAAAVILVVVVLFVRGRGR